MSKIAVEFNILLTNIVSRADLAIRCRGNALPLPDTEFGTLGNFYDAHRTVEHHRAYFTASELKPNPMGQMIHLELQVNIGNVRVVVYFSVLL